MWLMVLFVKGGGVEQILFRRCPCISRANPNENLAIMNSQGQLKFSRYQFLIIAFLSFIQFTVILDFMVIAPLGAMLMDIRHMSPAHFGWHAPFLLIAPSVSVSGSQSFAGCVRSTCTCRQPQNRDIPRSNI
jgi:hypothetical protein